MNPYSPYDYLAFVLPGGAVLFTAIYGWFGWPWKEPGATALVGLAAASFVIGNLLAAIGNWMEPLLTGKLPGKRPNGLWGQFAKRDRHPGEEAALLTEFLQRYGQKVTLEQGYRRAQTELRGLGKADTLDTATSRIGFYRGMASGMLVSVIIEALLAIRWHTHLPVALWVPLMSFSLLLFAYRYRHFWRLYGDYVIRDFRLLPPRN